MNPNVIQFNLLHDNIAKSNGVGNTRKSPRKNKIDSLCMPGEPERNEQEQST